MRITNLTVALLFLVCAPIEGAQAQSLRDAEPPAEFPPASFTGRQYVDSRGCAYIRAGINGNVTWVPRVTQQRQQVSGFQPSLTPAQLAQAPQPRAGSGDAPEILTLDPQAQPRRSEAEPAPAPRRAETRQPAAPSPGPAPTVFTNPPAPAAPAQTAEAGRAPAVETAQTAEAPKPRYVPSPGPAPTVFKNPAPQPVPAPQPAPRQAQRPAPAHTPSPGPEPTIVGARPAAPATEPTAVAELTPDTRVVRRHVHDNRQNTNNFRVPKGYRSAWSDGRLNPARSEHTLAPSLARRNPPAPKGYVRAWEDDRLNARRGMTTAAGDAQSDAIWTRTLPRKLVRQRSRGREADLPGGSGNSPFWRPPVEEAPAVTRLSTRSAPEGQPHYIRVALYRAEADARVTARAFARRGLPMQLGRARHRGAAYSAVLAGPFPSENQAQQALATLRQAGFEAARILR